MPLYCPTDEIARRYSEWLAKQESGFWHFLRMKRSVDYDQPLVLDAFLEEMVKRNTSIPLFEVVE